MKGDGDTIRIIQNQSVRLFAWPNLFDWPHLILDDRPPTDLSRSAHDICWCCRPSRKDEGIAGIWTFHIVCKDNQEISVFTSMYSFFGWILSFFLLNCMGFPSISTVQRIGLDVIDHTCLRISRFPTFLSNFEA